MSRQIGPSTTLHLQQMEQCSSPTAKRHGVSKADVVEPESSDTEDELYGPTLPPDMLAARNAIKPRVIGPSRPNPTQHGVTKPAQHVSIIDDEYGPVPLPVDQLDAQSEREREIRSREIELRATGGLQPLTEKAGSDCANEKPARGEWMLVPPTVEHFSADPLAKRPTGFRQNDGRGYRGPREEHSSSLWTESPAEKRERLTKTLPDSISGEHSSKPTRQESTYIETDRTRNSEMLKTSTKETRGPSLLEQHLERQRRKGKRSREPDEEVSLAFDRERDMAVQRVDTKRQREMLQKGNMLGDRFKRGGGRP